MIYSLEVVCDNSELLSVILFIKKLLDIVLIIVPVLLILMVIIDLGKNVVGNEEDMKKNQSIAVKRVIMAIFLFLVPNIVKFACGLAGEALFITDCWDGASMGRIYDLQNKELTLKMEEELKAKENTKSFYFLEDVRTIVANGGNGISAAGLKAGNVGEAALPNGSKYYPLDGKKNGKSLKFLEIDGKYVTDSDIKDINKFLKDAVNSSSDPGTKVALAGWALIYSLSEKNMKLHYQKTGVPNNGTVNNVIGRKGTCNGKKGFCRNWGKILYSSTASAICSSYGYLNRQGDCGSVSKYYSGLQCDGFVKWALAFACQRTGWGYYGAKINLQNYRKGKDFDSMEPGDLLGSDGHIMLFLKKSGKKYLIAESTSGRGGGAVIFHKYSKATLNTYYNVYKMKSAYNKYCKK